MAPGLGDAAMVAMKAGGDVGRGVAKNKHATVTALIGLAVAVVGYMTTRASAEAETVKTERDPRDERILRLEKSQDTNVEVINQLRERVARLEGRSAVWSERAKKAADVDVQPHELSNYQNTILKSGETK